MLHSHLGLHHDLDNSEDKMNWDIVQLIAAGIALWTGTGLCAAGIAFASAQTERAILAADMYNMHVSAFLITGLLAVIVCLLKHDWKYHGMLFPGAEAQKRAQELQSNARLKASSQ